MIFFSYKLQLKEKLTEVHSIFIFSYFLYSILFLFQDPTQDTTLHLVIMTHYATLAVKFLRLSLLLMTLTVLVRHFIDSPLIGICMISPLIRLKLWV